MDMQHLVLLLEDIARSLRVLADRPQDKAMQQHLLAETLKRQREAGESPVVPPPPAPASAPGPSLPQCHRAFLGGKEGPKSTA